MDDRNLGLFADGLGQDDLSQLSGAVLTIKGCRNSSSHVMSVQVKSKKLGGDLDTRGKNSCILGQDL